MDSQKRRSKAPKGILWYLGEHPDLLQRYTDLPGLLRRMVHLIKGKIEQARQALRYMGREKLARRFPESEIFKNFVYDGFCGAFTRKNRKIFNRAVNADVNSVLRYAESQRVKSFR